MGKLASLYREVTAWCHGRFWPARALLLVFFTYIGFRYLINLQYTSLFDGLNLGIHEAGHLVFMYTGNEFLTAAGGTILQLAAPLAAAIMFWRQPDYFALAVCGAWFATNLFGVATYLGDARSQSLPLVSVGGGAVEHDWAYMLPRLGILSWDRTIAGGIRAVAFLTMWSSILAGVWMVVEMALGREDDEQAEEYEFPGLGRERRMAKASGRPAGITLSLKRPPAGEAHPTGGEPPSVVAPHATAGAESGVPVSSRRT